MCESIWEGRPDKRNLDSSCYPQASDIIRGGTQLLVLPTQAGDSISARPSSYPISALRRPISRLPSVDGIDDMAIEDAVEDVASAMAFSCTLLAHKLPEKVSKADSQFSILRPRKFGLKYRQH